MACWAYTVVYGNATNHSSAMQHSVKRALPAIFGSSQTLSKDSWSSLIAVMEILVHGIVCGFLAVQEALSYTVGFIAALANASIRFTDDRKASQINLVSRLRKVDPPRLTGAEPRKGPLIVVLPFPLPARCFGL